MDDEDGFHEPNADEQRARLIAELSFEFMNASRPISSDLIWHTYYPELKRDSFSRRFLRDREDLAKCGVVLLDCDLEDGQNGWVIDERHSFAGESSLSNEDAYVLEVACRQLISDPTFPYPEDLRLALAKVNRSFRGLPPLALPAATSAQSPTLPTLEAAFDDRVACDITYRDAKGDESSRRICVLGLFGLRDSIYVVGASVAPGGSPDLGVVRDYKASRVMAAKPVKSVRYVIPEDFDIAEHVFLPFQLGPRSCDGVFFVSHARLADMRKDSLDRGEFEAAADGGAQWTVWISDVDAAASWAISEGIRPISPKGLVDAWSGLLHGHSAMKASGPVDPPVASGRRGRGRPGSFRLARDFIVLLSSLQREGDAITVPVVSDRLGISADEARFLIDSLVSINVSDGGYLPVSYDDEGIELMFGNGVKGRPLRLSRSETYALLAAMDRLGVADDDPVRQGIRLSVANASVASEEVERLLAPVGVPAAGESLHLCLRGLVDGRRVAFDYQGSHDDNPRHRVVEPSLVRRSGSAWLLDARDVDIDLPRTFRVDRMSDVVVTDEPFSPAQHVAAASDESRLVTLRLANPAYLNILEWPGLSVERVDGGVVIATISYLGGDWLPRHIAACGGTATTDDAELNSLVEAIIQKELASTGDEAR